MKDRKARTVPVERLAGAWGYDVDSKAFVAKLRRHGDTDLHIQHENGDGQAAAPCSSTPTKSELIERLAAIDHDQWCYWSQEITKDLDGLAESMLDLLGILEHIKTKGGTPENDCALVYLARARLEKTKERLVRWEKLWCAYTRLPDEMKQHDRVWAEKSYKVMRGDQK